MANATYVLTLGPLVTSVYKLEIGGVPANDLNKSTDTLKNVTIVNGKIQVALSLGGIDSAPWSISVTIDDKLVTKPNPIAGKIDGKTQIMRKYPKLIMESR